MTAARVAFMGGPADGRVFGVPVDATGQPMPEVHFHAYVWKDPNRGPAEYVARYRRTVNPADDGPLWVYLFMPGDPEAPVLSELTVAALDPSQVDGPGPGR